jgi:predicted RNase H-like HicB family nuclease
MKTLIRVYKEGKFYVAEDLVTNDADQGATEEEALMGLKKGLEEHYKILPLARTQRRDIFTGHRGREICQSFQCSLLRTR